MKPIVVTQRVLRSLNDGKHADPDRVFHAYRYTNMDGSSVHYSGYQPILTCSPGAELAVPRANTSQNNACASGVNVGTWSFVQQALQYSSHKVWLVEFTRKDIAAIPLFRSRRGKQHRKFRLFRCKVLHEMTLRCFDPREV